MPKSPAPPSRPPRRRRLRRLRWATKFVRQAAEPAADLLAAVTRAVLERSSVTSSPAPRRRPGRGSELSPALQCAVMVHAAVLGHGTRAIAQHYGVNRGTVRRVLATSTYQTFRECVMRTALEHLMDD